MRTSGHVFSLYCIIIFVLYFSSIWCIKHAVQLCVWLEVVGSCVKQLVLIGEPICRQMYLVLKINGCFKEFSLLANSLPLFLLCALLYEMMIMEKKKKSEIYPLLHVQFSICVLFWFWFCFPLSSSSPLVCESVSQAEYNNNQQQQQQRATTVAAKYSGSSSRIQQQQQNPAAEAESSSNNYSPSFNHKSIDHHVTTPNNDLLCPPSSYLHSYWSTTTSSLSVSLFQRNLLVELHISEFICKMLSLFHVVHYILRCVNL